MAAERDAQTFYLVEFEGKVASWCLIGADPRTGGDAWIDLKGRPIPYDDGRPIHHMAVGRVHELLGVRPLFGEILRRSAERHLLRPDSDQGWIDPAGTFFGCGFYAHDDLAHSFFGCQVGDLESAGYVRVHADSYQHDPYDSIDLTRAQRRTLEGLGFFEGPGGLPRRVPERDRVPLQGRTAYRPGDLRRLPPLGHAAEAWRSRREASRAARAAASGAHRPGIVAGTPPARGEEGLVRNRIDDRIEHHLDRRKDGDLGDR